MTSVMTDGRPLVLLNGITRAAESWDPFRALSTDDQVLALDGIGAGDAPMRSIPEQARRVLSRMDDEGMDVADIVGFSHGGLVAQQLAFVAPHRVRRLVLLATSCGAGATAAAFPWTQPPKRPATSAQELRAVFGQMMAISTWSSIGFLGAITAPTLVVHGRRDRFVPIENARVLARRIPGATLVELDSGHDLQRPDRVPRVAAVISDFLAWTS